MKFTNILASLGALAGVASAEKFITIGNTTFITSNKTLHGNDACQEKPGPAPCSSLDVSAAGISHLGETFKVEFGSSIGFLDGADVENRIINYKVSVSNGLLDVNGTMTFGEWLANGFKQEDIKLAETGSYEVSAEIVFVQFPWKQDGANFTTLIDMKQSHDYSITVIPSGMTIVPLAVTIGLALLTRNVYISLFGGIFTTRLVAGSDFTGALFSTIETYIIGAFTDGGHAYVIFFSVFLGGCVAMITRSGGAKGMAVSISKYASTPLLGQLATYVSGILVFFDDYSNALVVGNSMRPVTDILGVSREKLAFIVDATSAPIASIIPVSSWIAYEVGLINDMLAELTDEQVTALGFEEASGLSVFLSSIPYRFYPIVMLVFQVFLILTGLEFGPMLTYERKARYKNVGPSGEMLDEEEEDDDDIEGLEDKALEPEEDTPLAWFNGAVPILAIVFFMCYYIADVGYANGGCGKESCNKFDEECEIVTCDVSDIIANTDSYAALLYGGFVSFMFIACWYRVQYKADNGIVAPLTGGKPLMDFNSSVHTFVAGITALTPAIIVLLLAWGVGSAMDDIGTPKFFGAAVTENVAPGLIPALVFVMSAFIALATGTSWGTMAIMFPLISPIVAINSTEIYYSSVGSVLAGAVFGDHCSPISDTTVLSSLACKCNLFNHVGSQAPYAFFVAFFSTVFGDILASAGGVGAGGGIVLSLLTTLGVALIVAAPVSSETGRMDVFGRIALAVQRIFGKEDDSVAFQLAKKTAIAEQANPSGQFDLLRCIGGGVEVDALDVEPVKDYEMAGEKEEEAEFTPEL